MQPDLKENHDAAVENALLRRDVEMLTEQVAKLSQDVSNLVAAWNTATYIVAFVKWIAGAVVAISAIYAVVKGLGK
jgi:hypothetical protein